MVSFVDGMFAMATAVSVYVAVRSYRSQRAAEVQFSSQFATLEGVLADSQKRAADQMSLWKKSLQQETITLEAWTKHMDQEAHADYTALVTRLKNM